MTGLREIQGRGLLRRLIRGPASAEQWRPLEPEVDQVQFDGTLKDDEYRRLADLISDRPDVALRAYGGGFRDLEFLRFFPSLRHFLVDAEMSVYALDGLRHLPDHLETLGIGQAKEPTSLGPIERFKSLRSLYIEGPQRDINSIQGLESLEELTLRSITLRDLSLLRAMKRLRSFDLKLGGTKDLRLLPQIGRLEYVEIWRVRGLDDLSMLGRIPTLRHLFLQSMGHVKQLPSFARSPELRRVDLESMPGLTDLAPVAEAPNLEILNLLDFGHAQPTILSPFVGHPALRAGIWGFGSTRKNAEAQKLIPIPPEPWEPSAMGDNEPAEEPLPWDLPEWNGYRSEWRA